MSLLRKILYRADTKDRSFFWRYGIATIFVAVAFIARDSLHPVLGNQLPFTFLITSSILAAYVGGLGPGFYALTIGWLLADYFFVPPLFVFGSYGKIETISLISTLTPASLAIFLIDLLHRARRRARTEVAARRQAEAELVKAKEKLENANVDLERRVKERTMELEKSVQFLQGFCYSIAHDLRAPLRAIEGFVTALQEDRSSQFDETSREYSRRIVEATQRMDKLILDLLEYGRLSHVMLNVSDISLEEAVNAALMKVREKIVAKQAQVRINHPLQPVRADPKLMHSLLVQLLDNSLKFNAPGTEPRVEIWTETKNEMVRLSIHDNGIGIAREYRERIFGLFETLSPATKMTTGAGLAVVKKSVERMNGIVGVNSETGKGSTFWIELPRTDTSGRAIRSASVAFLDQTGLFTP